MALTDKELHDLKLRVVSAMGTGSNIGRANEILLDLIEEIQELRSTPTLTVSASLAGSSEVPPPELEEEAEPEQEVDEVPPAKATHEASKKPAPIPKGNRKGGKPEGAKKSGGRP